MHSSDTLYCFACSEGCAAQLHIDNQPDMHPAGFVFVRRADDLAGAELETLEVAMCKHRWNPGTVTAYNHMLWCIWQMDPVEVRYAESLGQQPPKDVPAGQLGRTSRRNPRAR